jgi:DNA-binding transcriptional LysR family regulator
MVDINKIETFLRAAEMLSFSETAKQLHISQPAVSHHIKTLEQEMGATLFTRTNTGLLLTEAGRLLLPWARRLLHDSNSMQAMMSSIQQIENPDSQASRCCQSSGERERVGVQGFCVSGLHRSCIRQWARVG